MTKPAPQKRCSGTSLEILSTVIGFSFFDMQTYILCYAKVLLGLQSSFRAGFRPDSDGEDVSMDSPAGLRPAGVPILMISQLESGRDPVWKPDFRPGSIMTSLSSTRQYFQDSYSNVLL